MFVSNSVPCRMLLSSPATTQFALFYVSSLVDSLWYSGYKPKYKQICKSINLGIVNQISTVPTYQFWKTLTRIPAVPI